MSLLCVISVSLLLGALSSCPEGYELRGFKQQSNDALHLDRQCYKIFQILRESVEAAEELCANDDAHLIQVDGEDENMWASQQASTETTPVLLGLAWDEKNSQFRWSRSEATPQDHNYFNWAEDEEAPGRK